MSTYVTKRAAELGIKVVDATKPLIVEVMPIDIEKASAANSKCCAFVRACERSMKVEAAFFFRTKAWLEYEDKIVRYELPVSVQKEIVAFDRSKTMAPGKYQLSAVGKFGTLKEKAKRRAKNDKNHKSKGKLPGQKRGLVHRTAAVRTAFEPTYRPAK